MVRWIAAALFAVSANSGFADWPEFRGPTGQGISSENSLPLTWSATENVTWKVPIDGVAWSSPVIGDGRIFLTTAVEGTDGSLILKAMALEEETGKEVWSEDLFEHKPDVEIHKKNSHASPTPILSDGVVYVHFGPHGTAALTTDGKVLWKNQELKYGPTHGNGGSPALTGDLLVICCDGHDQQFVAGLEKSSGKIRWKTPRDTQPTKGFSFSTPLVIDVNNQAQAICPASDAVFAYDPRDGKEIWRVRYADGYSVVPRPIFAGGLVFVCTGYNKAQLLAIDPTGKGDVTDTHVKWRTDKAIPHNPSPVAVGKEVYLVSDAGIASCLDVETGTVHWQERFGGKYSASPLAADSRIYFQDEEGRAIVVSAARTFEKLAENSFVENERTFASYAVDHGALYIRSENHLFRIDGKAQRQKSSR